MYILIHKLVFLVLLFPSALVLAHAQLLLGPAPDDPNPEGFESPLPRVDSVRMKNILPCGGLRGQPPVSEKGEPLRTYKAGSTIRVHWKETNDHPGVWRIDISVDKEQSWQILLHMKDGVDVGLSEATPKYYWSDISLPAGLQCDNCTIRLTQSMGDIDNGNDYYSCADVRIL